MAGVVRNNNTSAPSASEIERDDLTGFGALERVGQQQTGVRGAGPTDGRRKIVGDLDAEAPRQARAPRACGPVTIAIDTSPGVSSAFFNAAFHACSPSGMYLISPKRSSH